MDWISVNGRLPEEGEPIFVYGVLEHIPRPGIYKARYFSKINEYKRDVFWESEWAYDIDKVTHWMPLPKPPEK